MADLHRLSPAALSAAMRGGTATWGEWGSGERHILYVEPIGAEPPKRKRRMCYCGCRRKDTHRLAANGVTLAMGCELEMRRIKRRWEPRGG